MLFIVSVAQSTGKLEVLCKIDIGFTENGIRFNLP
jgi:hypothetical protein